VTSRPSEPLLNFLRDTIRRKGYSTAELAEKCGLERGALKRRLGGAEPLTVDDLVLISNALDLTPAEVGVAGAAIDEVSPVHALPNADFVPAPDPMGNLAEQVMRLGFSLGVDLFVVLDAKQLGDSGVPRTTLTRFADALPIRLEARYHRHNKPRFLPDHFGCVLSFDALYTCLFPWSAFKQVTFTLPVETPSPAPPEPPDAPGPSEHEPESSPRESGSRPPFLRVVK
jgi:transcriptional regulator with XRE-family HTH domain